MKIAVIGSGIFGLCVAKELAAKGVKVDIFEKGDITPKWASSSARTRGFIPPHGTCYDGLIDDAIDAWYQLLPRDKLIEPVRCLELVEAGHTKLKQLMDTVPEHAMVVEAPCAFPDLNLEGVVSRGDTHLIASQRATTLLAAVLQQKVTFRPFSEVVSLGDDASGVTLEFHDTGCLDSKMLYEHYDAVVSAGGAWCNSLLISSFGFNPGGSATEDTWFEFSLPSGVRLPARMVNYYGAENGGFYLFEELPGIIRVGERIGRVAFSGEHPANQLDPQSEARCLEFMSRLLGKVDIATLEQRSCVYEFACQPCVGLVPSSKSVFMIGKFPEGGFKFAPLFARELATLILTGEKTETTNRFDPARLTS